MRTNSQPQQLERNDEVAWGKASTGRTGFKSDAPSRERGCPTRGFRELSAGGRRLIESDGWRFLSLDSDRISTSSQRNLTLRVFNTHAKKIKDRGVELPDPATTFDETSADLSHASHIRPQSHITDMYNASGARWRDRTAVWSDSLLNARLYANWNPCSRQSCSLSRAAPDMTLN